jgi:transposase
VPFRGSNRTWRCTRSASISWWTQSTRQRRLPLAVACMSAARMLAEVKSPLLEDRDEEAPVHGATDRRPLRQAEQGTPAVAVRRKSGVSEATFYAWKKRYASMGVAEFRRCGSSRTGIVRVS